MSEATKDPWAKPFANGFTHFCAYCGKFFSITTSINPDEKPNFCSWCGDDGILSTQREFIGWCIDSGEDPIKHFYVLDGDEPVPGSKYLATPNQVKRVQEESRRLIAKDAFPLIRNIAFCLDFAEETVGECLEILEAGEW